MFYGGLSVVGVPSGLEKEAGLPSGPDITAYTFCNATPDTELLAAVADNKLWLIDFVNGAECLEEIGGTW